MQKIVKFLQDNPTQYLASLGLDGKPKCRPFAFMCALDNKLWFCTGTNKGIYAELQQNPYVELSVNSPQHRWLRLSGKAVFSDNHLVKTKCFSDPFVKLVYKSIDNPVFTVFYLSEATATISSFSDSPPEHYIL